jgi:hypothetical protein
MLLPRRLRMAKGVWEGAFYLEVDIMGFSILNELESFSC